MVTYRTTARGDADLDRVLHAVGDASQRRILAMLAHEDLTVSRIAGQFAITRPAVIKHLHVLRSANLVSVRRNGRERIQCLNARPLANVDAWLARFAAFWDESLHDLKRQVERDT